MPTLKEPNFFALFGENRANVAAKDITELDNYTKIFQTGANKDAIGEASPMYLSSKLAAKRIRQLLPDVKLVAILRRPSEAIFSNYMMNVRGGTERRTFHQVANEYIDTLTRRPESGPFYASQLQRYLDVFPREQLSVHFYEELEADPATLFASIFDFIGVNPSFKPVIKKWNEGRILHSQFIERITDSRALNRWIPTRTLNWLRACNTKQMPSLQVHDRQVLDEVFYEDALALEAILKVKLPNWQST